MKDLNSSKPPLICLILLISLPSVATVLISPALPPIASFFHITDAYAQQLITLAVVGYAFGQLLYSPLANRFGRKSAICVGMVLYLLSCLVCLFAIHAYFFRLLLFARFFMVLGASAGMVITFTIINDYYRPQEARSVVAYTVLAYAFMPAVAIVVGGFITTHFSWIDCFYVYLFYGVFVLLMCLFLPETLQVPDKHALKINKLLFSYFKAFSSTRLMLFSCIYGLMSAYIYIIASGAPFIGVDTIGLSSAQYGFLLIIPYSGQFLGALIAGRISRHKSTYAVMVLGYASVTLGCLLMLFAFLLGWVSVVSLMGPIFFIMMGLPITYSSTTVLALLDYKDKATGSAVMSFMTMGIVLVVILIFSLFPISNPIIMPISFIIVLILAIVAFYCPS